MRFVIEDAGFWKSCVSAIANIVDDGVFVATKEGITLKAIDPSGISMVAFNLPKEALQEYESKETEELGISFEDLEKITSRLRSGERLEVKKEGNFLVMNFGKRGKVKLNLIDSTNKVEKDPEYGKDAEITITAYDLKEMLKDASIFSSQVTFKLANKNFSIFARSENGEIEESCEENAIKEIKINNEESKATFSLEFLSDIIKACPDEADVKLIFGSDKPIRIEYAIGKANFIYYLAPIVEQ
jgi:proliferating cell nuclear antigen